MKTPIKTKTVIGRAEQVRFPQLDGKKVYARIDSGARTSAIWGSANIDDQNVLWVSFFGHMDKNYSFNKFGKQAVTSSNGHIDVRFTVKLSVVLSGRKIRATFTIANRQTQVYPVLIGRNVLRGKFIVDVQKGKALIQSEKKKIAYLEVLAKAEDYDESEAV